MKPPPEDESSVLEGCLAGFFGLIFAIAAALWIGLNALSIGLIQFIYFLPIIIILFRKGRDRAALASIMSAAAVFMLSAACAGISGTIMH